MAKQYAIPYAETRYGFKWGGGEFRRVCDRKSDGSTVTQLRTDRTALDIYVTRTGKVRVFTHDGGEWREEA